MRTILSFTVCKLVSLATSCKSGQRRGYSKLRMLLQQCSHHGLVFLLLRCARLVNKFKAFSVLHRTLFTEQVL